MLTPGVGTLKIRYASASSKEFKKFNKRKGFNTPTAPPVVPRPQDILPIAPSSPIQKPINAVPVTLSLNPLAPALSPSTSQTGLQENSYSAPAAMDDGQEESSTSPAPRSPTGSVAGSRHSEHSDDEEEPATSSQPIPTAALSETNASEQDLSLFVARKSLEAILQQFQCVIDQSDQPGTPYQQTPVCTTPQEEALVPSERSPATSCAVIVYVSAFETLFKSLNKDNKGEAVSMDTSGASSVNMTLAGLMSSQGSPKHVGGSPKSLRREDSSSSVTAALAEAALDQQATTPRAAKQPKVEVNHDASTSSVTSAFTSAATTTTTTISTPITPPPQSSLAPTVAPPTPKQSLFKPLPNQVLAAMGQAQQTLTRNAQTHRKEVLLELKKLDFTFRRHTEALEALLAQIGGNLTTLKHKVTAVLSAGECTVQDQDDFKARNEGYAQERGLLLNLKARLTATHSLLGRYIEDYKGAFTAASGSLDELARKGAIYRAGLDQLQLAWGALRKEWQKQQKELKTGIDDLDQLDRQMQGKLRELHTKVSPKDTEALKWLDKTPEIVLNDQPIAPEILAGSFPLIDAIETCQNQVLTRADTDNAVNLAEYNRLDVLYQQQAQEIAALKEKLDPLQAGLKTQVEALETPSAVATEADIGVCNEKSLEYVNLSNKLIQLRAKIEHTQKLIEHNKLEAAKGLFDPGSPNVAEAALKLKISIEQVTTRLLPIWAQQADVWKEQSNTLGGAVSALNHSDWAIRDLLVRFKHRLAPEPASVYGVYTWMANKLPGAYHSPFAYVAIPQEIGALQRQVQVEKKTERKE